MPIKFYDTAGLRPYESKAEEIGIKKAYNISNIADINLIFIEKEQEIHNYNNINNKIFVKSKIDISNNIVNKNIFNISSTTGEGFDNLFKYIYSRVCEYDREENMIVSRERHREAFNNTLFYLKKSREIKNFDIMAEDVRMAMKEISKITGNIDVENILEVIFNDFCIGK